MIGDAMYQVPGSRLREMSNRITELTARAERAEAAEADLRATRKRVRALAELWAGDDPQWAAARTMRRASRILLAALDAQRPAEGGPEGEGARTGVELIAAERRRQVEAEGWTPEHDAEHVRDQLARAAVCYATPPKRRSMRWHNVSATFGAPPDRGDRHVHAPADWPWHPDWWKPRDRLRDLVRAGALIAAEIDRLAALDGGQPDTPAPTRSGEEER